MKIDFKEKHRKLVLFKDLPLLECFSTESGDGIYLKVPAYGQKATAHNAIDLEFGSWQHFKPLEKVMPLESTLQVKSW